MESVKEKKHISNTLRISLIAVSAALYAAASAATSFIPTPWGVGNFRPGVIVPAFFAVACGEFVGGMGAAIGTFISSFALSLYGLSNPLLSLLSGVPGNFVGFYLLGYFVKKNRSWSAFVVGSFVSLVIGNLIAALGVVGFYITITPRWASWATDVQIGTVFGLTFFWVATMIPFVIPIVPALISATKPMMNAMAGGPGNKEVRWGKTGSTLRSTIAVSLTMAILYIVVMFSPLGDLVFYYAAPQTVFWVKTLLLISSIIIIAFGIGVTTLTQRRKTSLKVEPTEEKTKLGS